MPLQQQETPPLTDEEKRQIAEYEKIIAFSELMLSGKLPRYKITRVLGTGPEPEPVRAVTDTNRILFPIAPTVPRTNAGTRLYLPHFMEEAAPPLTPGHFAGTAPALFTATPVATPVNTSKSESLALDYSRDYYKELGVSLSADRNQLRTAILRNYTPVRRQAYNILKDGYLRSVYDDARAFAMDWRGELMQIDKGEKPASAMKMNELKIGMCGNYYKDLGVAPGASSNSILRAYRSKARLYSPDTDAGQIKWSLSDSRVVKKARGNWSRVENAYAVLGDAHWRSKYDMKRALDKSMLGYETAMKTRKRSLR